MMWKFIKGGATVIPGATSIPESRVHSLLEPTSLSISGKSFHLHGH